MVLSTGAWGRILKGGYLPRSPAGVVSHLDSVQVLPSCYDLS
jgi:hypothetical protein